MIPYRMNPIGSGWPREGSYGVFLTSSGTAVSSAIVMSGAIVSGPDYVQNVYSHGTARETIVSSGGSMYVFSGGTARSATITNAAHIYISSGGSADRCTLQSGGVMHASSGATANSTVVNSGGRMVVVSGCSASSISAANGAIFNFAIAPDTYIQGTSNGSAFVFTSVASNFTLLSMYINEIQQGSSASTSNPGSLTQLSIGRALSQNLDGYMTAFRIYNRVLDASEIADLAAEFTPTAS